MDFLSIFLALKLPPMFC